MSIDIESLRLTTADTTEGSSEKEEPINLELGTDVVSGTTERERDGRNEAGPLDTDLVDDGSTNKGHTSTEGC